ncbi:MAG: WYL domain-containing protein [Bacteroidales bacterium]
MAKREVIARQQLIVNKLRRTPCSFKELLRYLDLESELQGYDFTISKRTFERDVNDILSLYGVEIIYDSHIRAYRVNSDIRLEANQRMLEAFDIFNALRLTDRLHHFIHFENRKSKGTEFLYDLIQAIEHKRYVKFFYHKYWDDSFSERRIAPYALKEFKNRWYLLGTEDEVSFLKSFSLDRMSQLKIMPRHIQEQNAYDISTYFRDCFGIIGPNGQKAEKVVLAFNAHQGKYIKSLPLHDSQIILEDTSDKLIVELFLVISQDFIMELLSHGDNLCVLQPIHLRNNIKSILTNALKNY